VSNCAAAVNDSFNLQTDLVEQRRGQDCQDRIALKPMLERLNQSLRDFRNTPHDQRCGSNENDWLKSRTACANDSEDLP